MIENLDVRVPAQLLYGPADSVDLPTNVWSVFETRELSPRVPWVSLGVGRAPIRLSYRRGRIRLGFSIVIESSISDWPGFHLARRGVFALVIVQRLAYPDNIVMRGSVSAAELDDVSFVGGADDDAEPDWSGDVCFEIKRTRTLADSSLLERSAA